VVVALCAFVFSLENQRSSGKIEHPCTCPLEENDQGLRLGLTDKIHLAVIFHPSVLMHSACLRRLECSKDLAKFREVLKTKSV
jgi:hypothetical protein